MFLNILVPYMPPSWDLTGNLYFTFTVPLAQLMAVGITGTLAWFFSRPAGNPSPHHVLGMLERGARGLSDAAQQSR